MNCISIESINKLKSKYKKCIIHSVIVFILFCIAFLTMLFVTNREYKQLFIIVFSIIFSILLNLTLYIFKECILKYRDNIRLYEHLLEKKFNVDEVVILDYIGLETYEGVVFAAYTVFNKDNKKYRVLLDPLYKLDIDKKYILYLSQGVVISYENE